MRFAGVALNAILPNIGRAVCDEVDIAADETKNCTLFSFAFLVLNSAIVAYLPSGLIGGIQVSVPFVIDVANKMYALLARGNTHGTMSRSLDSRVCSGIAALVKTSLIRAMCDYKHYLGCVGKGRATFIIWVREVYPGARDFNDNATIAHFLFELIRKTTSGEVELDAGSTDFRSIKKSLLAMFNKQAAITDKGLEEFLFSAYAKLSSIGNKSYFLDIKTPNDVNLNNVKMVGFMDMVTVTRIVKGVMDSYAAN